MANRLSLFAGVHRKEGWHHLDMAGGEFKATIPPFTDAVKATIWDEVEWIHGINVVYPWTARVILAELRAIMRPGGKLILEQPSFRKCLEAGSVAWFYGDPSRPDPASMVKWCYTPSSLSELLAATGFRDVSIEPAEHHVPERDFRAVAYA